MAIISHHYDFARIVDRVGRRLTGPTELQMAFAGRMTAPFKPGWHGQRKSAILELGYRVSLLIPVVPLLLWTASLGATGGVLRLLANGYRHSFIHSKPEMRDSVIDPTHLSVMSYNTLLMPRYVCENKGVRSPHIRIGEIARQIIAKDCTFVKLQEVFDLDCAEVLAEQLTRHGYHCLHSVAHRSFGYNSGLFLASKYPLENIRFHKYDAASGWDALSNKGVLLATAKVGDSNLILANTHLNEDHSHQSHQLQRKKLQQAITEYSNLLGSHQGLFLSGDYNIHPGCPAWNSDNNTAASVLWNAIPPGGPYPTDQMVHDFHTDYWHAHATTSIPKIFSSSINFQKDAKQGGKPETGWDVESADCWPIEKGNRLDYILLDRSKSFRCKQLYSYAMGGGSDHLAIIGHFSL
jgi:exonuclease III